MDKEKTIRQYRKIVGENSAEARELIKQLDNKSDPYLLQCIAQTYLDESLLNDDGTMREYIDKRKWRLAEKYIIQAFTLDENDPDVLWVMGKVRKVNGQIDIAIFCFERIIQLGVRKIASGTRKPGILYGKEMVNDSRFELYRIYFESNGKLAEKYLSLYKKGLKAGAPTIYRPLKKFLLK